MRNRAINPEKGNEQELNIARTAFVKALESLDDSMCDRPGCMACADDRLKFVDQALAAYPSQAVTRPRVVASGELFYRVNSEGVIQLASKANAPDYEWCASNFNNNSLKKLTSSDREHAAAVADVLNNPTETLTPSKSMAIVVPINRREREIARTAYALALRPSTTKVGEAEAKAARVYPHPSKPREYQSPTGSRYRVVNGRLQIAYNGPSSWGDAMTSESVYRAIVDLFDSPTQEVD